MGSEAARTGEVVEKQSREGGVFQESTEEKVVHGDWGFQQMEQLLQTLPSGKEEGTSETLKNELGF